MMATVFRDVVLHVLDKYIFEKISLVSSFDLRVEISLSAYL
jgi:hypothetical protein